MPRCAIPRLSAVVAATLGAAFAACAQEGATGLEEVLVTAQRVETDIHKTPVAVTSLSGDFLQEYDFRRVTSISRTSTASKCCAARREHCSARTTSAARST